MFYWKTIDRFSTFLILFAFILPVIFIAGIFYNNPLFIIVSTGLFLFELISSKKFIINLYSYSEKTKVFVIKIIALFFLSMLCAAAGKFFLNSSIILVIPAILSFFTCWFGAKKILIECNELVENEFKRK